VAEALNDAVAQTSEAQFQQIAEQIDESMGGIVELLTYGMQESWQNEARASGGWGEKYANAIKAEVNGNTGEIYVDETLVDKESNKPNMMFVNMVEQGMKSFSIKDALMRSDKAKISSDGVKYMSIPMPVSTPRTAGQGKQQTKFGKREMTREAYNIVKNGGKFSGSLKKGGEVAGLTKYVTRQFHGQYGMFLTVSENSKGFVHPGKAATPVYPKVLAEVNKRIGEVIQEFVKGVVKEYTK